MQRNEQTATADVYQPTLQTSSPFSAMLLMLLGILLLGLVIFGLITNWGMMAAASSILVRVVIVLATITVPVTLISIGAKKGYLSWVEIQHANEDLKARQDERRRANEQHAMHMYLAESRLHADERGNRPFVLDKASGQVLQIASGNFVQPVPTTYHYSHTDSSTRAASEQEALAAAAAAAQSCKQPTLETIIEELRPNSLEFAFGMDPLTGQLVKTTLPKSVHIQLLGASGQGKSRQATSILTQLCATNDPQHLGLALIDCEGETTDPFQHLPHVQHLALDPREAARTFKALVNELERRDISRVVWPVLFIFVEEFLNLRRTMPADYRDQALEDYTTLALRGRKRGMFLFSIGQTAYTEKAIRDAQNQFLSSMAFACKPTAARSAGFTNTELLNKLYSERRPGQFLLERPAGDSILLAPFVDPREVHGFLTTAIDTESRPENRAVVVEEESHVNATRNPSRKPLEDALQAKQEQVRQLIASGSVNKADIIMAVWGVRSGASEKYKQAEQEYKHILAYLVEAH